MNPKISIITIVLNRKRYIEDCIKNIIDQQCLEAEHIIVDGGSSDGTVEVIEQYASENSHIRWVSEKDEGACDAINKGIALSNGDIISICNSDDYYEPNVLNKVLAIFKKCPEPSLVVGNGNVWNVEGKLCAVSKPNRLNIIDLLLEWKLHSKLPYNPTQYFYHKSIHDKMGPWDVNLFSSSNKDFVLRAVRVAHVKYFDDIWGNFRILKGTRTYQDIAEKQLRKIELKTLDLHRHMLPMHLKLMVYVKTRIKQRLINLGKLGRSL